MGGEAAAGPVAECTGGTHPSGTVGVVCKAVAAATAIVKGLVGRLSG